MGLQIDLSDYRKFKERYNYPRGRVDKELYNIFIRNLAKNFYHYKSDNLLPIIYEIEHYAWANYIVDFVQYNLSYKNCSGPVGKILKDVEKLAGVRNKRIKDLDNPKYITHFDCFYMSFAGNG